MSTTGTGITKQIAKHFREIYFGGNWTCSNLKQNLADVTWQKATASVHSFNTIITLVYHISYYVSAVIKVLEGNSLNAKDKYSFNHPPVNSEAEWRAFLDKVWADAETFAAMIEQLPDDKLWETMVDEKYGSYYRNFHGIIEHAHYHLGQIVLIKKFLNEENEKLALGKIMNEQ